MKHSDTEVMKQELEIYRSIMGTLFQTIVILNKNKKITHIYGTSKIKHTIHDILGSSLYKHVHDPTSPYQSICTNIDQIFDLILTTGKTINLENKIQDEYITATVSKLSHKRIAVQIHHKAITQKENESTIYNELSGALNAGDLSSWSYNVKQKIFSSVGHNPVIGEQMSWDEFVSRVDSKHHSLLRDAFDQIIHHGSKFQKIIIEVYNLSNKKIWLNLHAIPCQYSSDGKASLIIGSQKDATKKLFYENSRATLIKQNKLILDNANSGFVYMTTDYQILWENVSKVFTDPQIINHFHVGTFYHKSFENKNSLSCLRQSIQQAMISQKTQYDTFTTRDGLSVELIVNPIVNEGGNVEGVVLRIDDITEREVTYTKLKQSEEANVATNQLLLTILECMPCTFFIKDANDEYKYIIANKGFCVSIGNKKDIIEKTDFDIFPVEAAKYYRAQDMQVIERNDTLTTEEELRTNDGETTMWHITKFPLIDERNNRKLIIGVALDITEHIKGQQELENSKALLEFSFVVGNIIPWEWDLTTGQMYSNSKKAIFYDQKITFDEFIDTFVHPDHRRQFHRDSDNLIKGKTSEMNLKILTLRSDKYEWTHIVGQKIKDPQKKHFKILGISRIITEEVEQQQELKRAKKKAEQSDALKSAFLANMSHEIRTPLNALVGFSQLMHSAETREERDEYQRIINANSEHLLNLINDILDLSKIEAGYINCNNTTFDLVELFTEQEIMIRPKLKKGVQLISNKPARKLYIRLDRFRVAQIITNFLSNAAKFTEEGSIEMGFSVIDEGIQIYVKDTGIGIEKKNIEKVFDRFEKFNKFAQGTGLGMAICKAIVDVYNGKIGVTSNTKEGSLFWAWFPCELFSEEKEFESTNAIPPQITNEQTITNSNILLAEDNDSNYLLLKTMLRNNHVERVTNGIDAVHYVKNKSFDIVLMDINIPIMDGLEATKQIRQFNNDIPILAITANAFEADRLNALEAGCSDFITKPINTDLLSERISYWINKTNCKL